MAIKPKNPKYIPKPYEQMNYPGERVQIDVKFVPAACLVGAAAGKKFYQYTAIDEFSRYRYLEAFEENSTYSSTQFLIHMLDHFQKLGFSVKCVHTPALPGRLSGAVHLFLRRLPEKAGQVVRPPGYPSGVRSDRQRF